jgi:hypothetical protein
MHHSILPLFQSLLRLAHGLQRFELFELFERLERIERLELFERLERFERSGVNP